MRLLFVSHSFPPLNAPLSNVGGMQRVATELHEALLQSPSVQAKLLVLRSSWEQTHLKTPLFLFRSAREIKRLVKSDAIDLILFSSMVTASLAVLLKNTLQKSSVKTATIVHGQDVTTPFGLYQWFVPRVFDALDAVFPVSRATGEQCTQRGLPESRLHVIPNGVKLSRFEPLTAAPAMRLALLNAVGDTENPLPDDVLLLCSVGRQVKRKGFAWFIENVMTHLPENVHYWLAGDGPETEDILQKAQENNLSHRVRLLGRISDEHLSLLYRGADLFIMPNIPVPGTMEGFGVVMLEAGMGGLPVVAARLEGIQDVITEGQNGHYVESGDAGGFKRAILKYHQSRQSIDAASQRAYQHTVDTFGWEAVAAMYIEELSRL